MTILLLDCNKVSKECFDNLELVLLESDITVIRETLTAFGSRTDILSYADVCSLLKRFEFDAVVIADIFWSTGQNICRWSHENNNRCFFWQHGQWIYTKNKKNPRFLPTATFFLGDDVCQECSRWPYGKRSKLMVTGSPRYDTIDRKDGGTYIYFSPPVLLEKSPSVADRYNYDARKVIEKLSDLDKEVDLMVHPHYREGHVDELRQMFPRAQFENVNENALDLIQNAEKVLTHRNSTVILDAIACGKQVVTMNFDILPSSYAKGYFSDFVLESDSPDHCLHNLTEPSNLPEDYENQAKKHILLGDASRRMTDYILGLV